MALKKTLAERLFKISRLTISNQSLSSCRISNPAVLARIPQNPSESNIAPDPGDNGIFRRLFHKRAMFRTPVDNKSIQIGENVMEKLRALDISKNRIRLDGLIPPAIREIEASPAERKEGGEGLTVADARKLLKVAQLEMVKSRLREMEMEKSWISYPEFVRVCGESCSDREQGVRIANTLDESGNVIVLGNVVFLKPEQENVLRTIKALQFPR
ncbi:hypothetical protein M5689_012500 [Euphorbia peplus]|nr:hypothetical protein M5689_012500 [Euphorbia peplus]